MQKIEFRVHFQEIIFKAKPRRPFTVKLVAQDEEGNESRREQITITAEQEKVDIGALAPFEFVMLVDEGRSFYMGKNLYFIVERTPIISRKIPLHLSNIYDHFLSHFDKVPLERVYAFEEGKIIYGVRISRNARVTDEGEIAYYQQKFDQFPSLSSSRIKKSISQSTISQGEGGSKMRPRPSFFVQDQDEKLEGQETMDLQDDSSDKGEGGVSYLQSWQVFSQMQKQHRQAEQPKQVKKQIKSKGLALKIIVALVLVGFFVLWIDASYRPKVLGKKKQEKGKMKYKAQKKVRKKDIKQKA